ncbi:MAG: LysM peptidoglycan-binding domain-containing protein [Planctomycetes bacterium]|nr:LysM peptidoglycan-binding domain-containing protein [Planctomycetota bacterium]
MKKTFFIIILPFFIVSCNYLEEQSTPLIKTLNPPEKNEITSVAIVPFQNKSEKPGADDVLRKSFFTHFGAKGYSLIRLEEIDERINLAGIDRSKLENENLYNLGRMVKADALVFGTVTKCDKHFFGVYSQVVFSAEMKMVDARTSEVIWEAGHTEKMHSDSIPVSVLGIPMAVVDSSINVREKVIEDTVEHLVRKFMASVPCKEFCSLSGISAISIKTKSDTPMVFYTVQAGDTLYSISRKFFDDNAMVKELCQANEGISADSLTVGQELIIPAVPILNNIDEIQYIEDEKYKRAVYRIRWGDNLYKLASKAYNDAKNWRIIYDANKNEIKNIEDVPVGQVIIIPLQISRR